MDKRHFLRLAASAPLMFALAPNVLAQAYPARPIRLIAPFAAGSTSDTSARFMAQHLSTALGQSVTVDNQPGADGRLGMQIAKNAPADGYTLVLGSWTNLAVNPVLIKDLPYDPLKDFKPISGVGRSMLGIAVSGQSNIKTLGELIDAAKKDPKKLNFGNFGTGYRLAAEWLSQLAGVQFTHVPYRTTSQMNTDLAGRQIDVGMDGVPSMAGMLKSGQLRMLAVTGDQRHSEFPDVPTVKESYPDFSIYGWSAIMVRSDVPDDIVEKLADESQKILSSNEGREYSRRIGSQLLQRKTGEMRNYQTEQINILRRVAEASGLKPQ